MISRTEDTYSQSVDGGLDIMVELLTVKPFHKSLSHPQVTTSGAVYALLEQALFLLEFNF